MGGRLIKRPIIWFGAALIFGESFYWGNDLYKSLIRKILVCVLVITVVMALLCLCFRRWKRGKKTGIIILAFIFCSIAVLIICWKSIYLQKLVCLENYLSHGEMVELHGNIVKIEDKEYSSYFYLEDVTLYFKNRKINVNKVLLQGEKKRLGKYGEPGYGIICKCKYKKFTEGRNVGSFDEKKYYYSIGISGKFSLENNNVYEGQKQSLYRNILYRIKMYFEGKLAKITNKNYLPLYKGIIFGDKNGIDEETKELYKLSGISHLLAISGLHIAIIGLGVYRLCRKFLLIIPSAAISVIIVIGYGIMVGNTVSATRAIIMFLIKILADIMGRTYDILSGLMTAFIVVYVTNPLSVDNGGMMLSFGAIIGITIIYDTFSSWMGIKYKLIDSLVAGESISMVTKPVLLYNYYEVCNYSSIVNVIVVPLMSLVIGSGLMGIVCSVFSITLGKLMIWPGCIILKIYGLICEFVLLLPNAVTIGGIPEKENFICYYALLFILIIIIKIKMRSKSKKRSWIYSSAMYVIIVVVLNVIIFARVDRGVRITMVDVGQGECICINDGKNVIVTDAGSSDINNVGKYVILPYLKASGVRKIDFLIVTHCDSDHINGMSELIDFKYNNASYVKNLVLADISDKAHNQGYDELVNQAEKLGINVVYVKSGDKIEFNNYKLDILWPDKGENREINQLSIVYRLKVGKYGMLFTGDLGEEGERIIINNQKNKIKNEIYNVDILKVGHHGSSSSTSEDFLRFVNPKVALISCGEGNPYGHPHKETMERLEADGISIYRTDQCGAIIIEIKKDDVRVRGYVCP